MADVRYMQATRIYPGTDAPAVDALDLHIDDGEFVVLVGPSGSGKTTALRMLAGLEEVDAGAIFIGERDVTDVAPKNRDIAMVFQNYALYPYLSVAANIGFPLKLAKVTKAEREASRREVADLLGLTEYLERKPGQLSGGQRQRVAMGRAIVRQPSVFLMDEPLSNLDAKLRVQMRADIAELQARLGTTTVYVTHDQAEAMTLGHRVAVLKDGRLQQCDTAPGAVRPAGQRVRRRVHRLSGDEPLHGPRARRTARSHSAAPRFPSPPRPVRLRPHAAARTSSSASGPRRSTSRPRESRHVSRSSRSSEPTRTSSASPTFPAARPSSSRRVDAAARPERGERVIAAAAADRGAALPPGYGRAARLNGPAPWPRQKSSAQRTLCLCPRCR